MLNVMLPILIEIMQNIFEWTYSRAENSKQSAGVYVTPFLRLSMTKCLLVKWRHYTLNTHQLRVLIPVSIITLLCLHISTATGVACLLGRPGFVRVTGTWRGKARRGRPKDEQEQQGWFWLESQHFWEELDLSISQPHLAQDTGDEAPGHNYWPLTVQSKQVALDIFSLVGLWLTIGQK